MKNLENAKMLNEMDLAKVAGGYDPSVRSPEDGLPAGILEKYNESMKQHGQEGY